MSADDRWLRVRDLFEQALDQDPAAVDGWLDVEARGDPDVRAEVRSLLASHAKAGSFLDEPAGSRLPDRLVGARLFDAGQVVGPYTIEREIGRGGMGVVYLATDGRLARQVALKALFPDLTIESSHRDRFRREARAAAALTHPGICTIYSLDEIDGELFIATERVDGHTLRDEIGTSQPPAPDDIVRTARELAAALAHAHHHGVTHRDLKPENVMRTGDGRLKILDFGLARIDVATLTPAGSGEDRGSSPAAADWRATQPGVLVGTPAYMAPEQLHARPADARADVFAFGVLLYEYACGVHPFEAETSLAMAARILEGDASPIHDRRPDLPPVVVQVIDRCLRKAAGDRFASGSEIAAALDRPAARPARRMTAWWRTHQLVIIAMYLLACGLAWQIKEWQPGVATALFVAAGIAVTIATVFRGHLLFTERMNPTGLVTERPMADRATRVLDPLLALILLADGALLAMGRPLAGVLTISLGVGIALVRFVVEPATTAASFGEA